MCGCPCSAEPSCLRGGLVAQAKLTNKGAHLSLALEHNTGTPPVCGLLPSAVLPQPCAYKIEEQRQNAKRGFDVLLCQQPSAKPRLRLDPRRGSGGLTCFAGLTFRWQKACGWRCRPGLGLGPEPTCLIQTGKRFLTVEAVFAAALDCSTKSRAPEIPPGTWETVPCPLRRDRCPEFIPDLPLPDCSFVFQRTTWRAASSLQSSRLWLLEVAGASARILRRVSTASWPKKRR